MVRLLVDITGEPSNTWMIFAFIGNNAQAPDPSQGPGGGTNPGHGLVVTFRRQDVLHLKGLLVGEYKQWLLVGPELNQTGKVVYTFLQLVYYEHSSSEKNGSKYEDDSQ